jgi:hypothetical protein
MYFIQAVYSVPNSCDRKLGSIHFLPCLSLLIPPKDALLHGDIEVLACAGDRNSIPLIVLMGKVAAALETAQQDAWELQGDSEIGDRYLDACNFRNGLDETLKILRKAYAATLTPNFASLLLQVS